MDTLEFGGKTFVSAVRAAKEHGYTADYMGQLIRAGKLTGQKVGRAWYVEMDSLSAYLGREGGAPVEQVVTTPAQVEEVVEVQPESVVEESAPEVHPIKISVAEEVEEVSTAPSSVAETPREKYQMLTYIAEEEEPELPVVEKKFTQTAEFVSEAVSHPVSMRADVQERVVAHDVVAPRITSAPILRPAQRSFKEVVSPDHYFDVEEKKGAVKVLLGGALAWCLVFGVFGFGIMSIFAAKEVTYTTGQEAAAAVALSLETLDILRGYILGSN